MKEYKYLYRKMLDKELILRAYKNMRKGKTKRYEIIFIDAHLDEEVDAMYEMILNTKPVDVEHPEKAFVPIKHEPRIIHEQGKDRVIYMPEIHEQWLHHIIILVLAPIIEKTAYAYSCGSFPGRGAHFAKKRLESWIRNEPPRYYAKIDIRHFYNNVRLDVLMRELRIRIKDEWFLHIIYLCLKDFKRGIPLGYYISQWLANYLLEPLDYYIIESGFDRMERYMDDIVILGNNKKKLRELVISIKMFIGRRFRLRLKRNYQVIKFDYGERFRPIDFMGFVFFRNRTIIRKRILFSASRLARRLYKIRDQGRLWFKSHLQAMVSYMGWFSWSDTYGCYLEHIKPYINVGKLKKIISKLDRKESKYENMERRAVSREAGGITESVA